MIGKVLSVSIKAFNFIKKKIYKNIKQVLVNIYTRQC